MKTLGTALAIGAITLASLVGCSQPEIKEKDFTGDGIPDIIVKIKDGFQHGEWLFIGQKDSTYIRAIGSNKRINHRIYFKTDSGAIYIFDGKFYREAAVNNLNQ